MSNLRWAGFLILMAVSSVLAQTAMLLPPSRQASFNSVTGSFDINQQDYYSTAWTHVGPVAPAFPSGKSALLSGTNHVHSAGWNLTACRTGTSRYFRYNWITPDYYGDSTYTNREANLQNTLVATIASPFYQQGIGCLYFEAINVDSLVPGVLAVELATNMLVRDTLDVTNVMFDAESDTLAYNWQSLDTLTLNALSSNDFTRFQRRLNYRSASRFRIRRTTYDSAWMVESGYLAVDNIRASPPPSDVVISLPDAPFVPAYPSAGSNVTLRCFVDNVDPNVPTSNDMRTVTCHYRWRYRDQASNAWASAEMILADAGDGAGNRERYEAVLPPPPDEGELEYFVTCAFGGYRYKPTDYTLNDYVYFPNAEGSETLSPRTLWADGVEGRPFSVSIRPYASSYGDVRIVSDQHAEPIAMRLTGDDEWTGWVPCRDVSGELTVQFRGTGRCPDGDDTISDETECWSDAGLATTAALPCAGVCAGTNGEARTSISVDGCGYVRLTFNTRTLAYTACRAEYQNFNGWAAPSATFTFGDDGGMEASFSNTFDSWPTQVAPSLAECFAYEPTVTNVQATPFATGGGWMAVYAANVTERFAATGDNAPPDASNFLNVALRLQGGNTDVGSVYTTVDALSDGLGEFSFLNRIGQRLSRDDIAYQLHGFTNWNYAVLATVKADNDLSPECPSLSVIGCYQDRDHFYEFRMSHVTNAADLSVSGDLRKRLELYKWVDGVPYRLAVNHLTSSVRLSTETAVQFRFFKASDTSVDIRCRFDTSDVISYRDTGTVGGGALKFGTYGFLSSDCRSRFSNIRIQQTTTSAILTGSPVIVLSEALPLYLNQIDDWCLPSGRFSSTPLMYTPNGIYSVRPTQTIGVYLMTSERASPDSPASQDDPGWSKVAEVTCSSFSYATNRIVIDDWRAQHVMLRNMGRDDGVSVDVTVDELRLSPWRGQTVSDSGDVLSCDWLATEAWTISNATDRAVSVVLDHGHADPDQDQTLRSPLLMQGMGVLEFDCQVSRAPARLKVQYATVDAPDAWTDVMTWETNGVTESFVHVSAEVEVGSPGYMRVLNAYGGDCTNAAVVIDQAEAWNVPPAGSGSWSAYNAKISAADTSRVWLDGSKACFLNNSRTQETVRVMDQHEPYLQTPLLTNGLGTLTFFARAYGTNETATVRLLASTNGVGAADAQWFEVHRFEGIASTRYRTFSYAPEDGRSFSALRLATSTTEGASRVCLEEIAVAEPAAVAVPPLSQRIPSGARQDAACYAAWLDGCGLANADLSDMDACRFDSAWLFDQNPLTFVAGEVVITEVSLADDTVRARFAVQAVTDSGRVDLSRLNGRLVLLGAASLSEPFTELADVSDSTASGQLSLPKSVAAFFIKLAVVFPE